eukprot:SAG11_NODE_2569_length_3213_cov_1.421002_5_plen_90_part_01
MRAIMDTPLGHASTRTLVTDLITPAVPPKHVARCPKPADSAPSLQASCCARESPPVNATCLSVDGRHLVPVVCDVGGLCEAVASATGAVR